MYPTQKIFLWICLTLAFYNLIAHVYISKVSFNSAALSPISLVRVSGISETSKIIAHDTTFKLKIENDKRVLDEALRAKLIREIKVLIAQNHLKPPYSFSMAFTRGARDVETFLFGENIFYFLVENGYLIKGKTQELPEEIPNPVPQVKLINGVIYIILSRQ